MKKKIFLLIISVFFMSLFYWLILGIYDSADVSKCEFSVYRFEQEFFETKVDSFDQKFPSLYNNYPNFFSDSTIDYKNDVFLNDTLNRIFDSVQVVFKDSLLPLEKLQEGFCNYKKYFPLDSFDVYTYIEGTFDYRYPVVYANKSLYISLDLFLGRDHSFYNSFPEYIKYSYDMDFIPSYCFTTLAGRYIPFPHLDNLLSFMLYHAKAYFFTTKMLPDVSDHHLFKFEEQKMKWCHDNEKVIWEYMIENDYLFSTSYDMVERFISLAPFSKFGLDIDQNSPGSVGAWLGLQILNSYAENKNITLVEILNETDYMKILNNSGYKP